MATRPIEMATRPIPKSSGVRHDWELSRLCGERDDSLPDGVGAVSTSDERKATGEKEAPKGEKARADQGFAYSRVCRLQAATSEK